MPGPKRQSTLLVIISSPMQTNSSSTSSLLKVAAIMVPMGRLNALVPQSKRMPEGPSSQQPQGIPNSVRLFATPPKAAAVPGVTLGLPIPSPRIMQERSSSDN